MIPWTSRTGSRNQTSNEILRASEAGEGRRKVLANAPSTLRIWYCNLPDPTTLVSGYLARTQHEQPGTTAQLSTYSLVHGSCGETTTPGFIARYRDWVDKLANGIGNFRVVLYFEVDSLITAPCLPAHDRHVRLVDERRSRRRGAPA